MYRKNPRFLTKEDIAIIKSLSSTHYVKDIVKITGISKIQVLKVQNNPANGVINPKRKCPPRHGERYRKVEYARNPHVFNIDDFAKHYSY